MLERKESVEKLMRKGHEHFGQREFEKAREYYLQVRELTKSEADYINATKCIGQAHFLDGVSQRVNPEIRLEHFKKAVEFFKEVKGIEGENFKDAEGYFGSAKEMLKRLEKTHK